ncbi:hypothetical protein [Rubinisphaera brasiliensis]|uniref:PH domain-containing protein n=1 Tax=Rubinisphaera brasiliensis (strain ATCC 49424 / DSM 5305 / JCM 21570 / IAM 15109 / NBRC 103401 / IFAM 1448) TaxID=756272 RepID=F0SHJ9_RUBBR|nr:hypothetical protein [Rubinisphaera brasiliensis]ADY58437.1 hypothetical protein Plabr_0814 [Rubinisphaera brasiliensis DSM 5305]
MSRDENSEYGQTFGQAFPENDEPLLRLKPDGTRSYFVLYFSAVAIWFGFKIVQAGNPEGWFLLTLFTLSTIAALLTILPGSSGMEVDADKVTVTSSFRQKQYRWEHIEKMGLFQVGMVRRVGFDFNARYPGPERVPNFAKPPSGWHITLPPMSGMEAEDLLDLMQRCHASCQQQNEARLAATSTEKTAAST